MLTNTTSTSRVLFNFNKPLPAGALSLQHEPVSFSESATSRLKQHWQKQLLAKQAALYASGIASVIKPYHAADKDSLDALFADDKPVMWPGTAIALRNVSVDEGSIRLTVSEISYPFISALNDSAFRAKLYETGLSAIRPPLAICTFAITTDVFLVMTIRGITTNVYPGRLYGQGGNPAALPLKIIDHQLDELYEELLINREEVDETSFRFYGLVEDLEQFPGKPDLIGSVRLRLSSSEVQARFDTRPSGMRPPDVAGISMLPFNKDALRYSLLVATKATDYCPPAFGGLVLLMQQEFGE